MHDLLELNKSIFLKSYLWISIIFGGLFGLYIIFTDSNIPVKWIIIIYIISLVIVPSFILLVWIFDWFRKRKYKKKMLSKKPYSDLKKIGFINKTIQTNHNSLKDYTMYAEINDCKIIFDININKPKVAEFIIYGHANHLTDEQYSIKAKELKNLNIDFTGYSFIKRINIKKEILKSTSELEKQLIELTLAAKQLKYEPIITE